MQADLDEAKRALADAQKKMAMSKEQAAAQQNAAMAQRTKCDLAKRAVNIFMAGR